MLQWKTEMEISISTSHLQEKGMGYTVRNKKITQ
jgi:hypothetical protein